VILITAFLSWVDSFGQSFSSFKIGVRFLISNDHDEWLGIGYFLVLCAGAAVAGALVKNLRILSIVGGGIAAIMGILFIFQANGLVQDAKDLGVDLSLFDFITFFPILTILAGGGAIAGGVINLSQDKR
jgi:hypothetical protein